MPESYYYYFFVSSEKFSVKYNEIPVSSSVLVLSRWKCYLFGLLGPQIWTIHSGSAFLFEFGSIDGTFVGGSIVTDARS